MIEWKCHICGETRADRNISVRSTDKSEELGLPSGTFQENVRYCNDNDECIEGSKTHSHFKSKEEAQEEIQKQVERFQKMTNLAMEEFHERRERFRKNRHKFYIFCGYFIGITVLGSFISSFRSDVTFLEQLLNPWMIPVRLILAFIVFKLRKSDL